jgi:hypothetical protein
MEHSVTGAIRNLAGQPVYWCSATRNPIAGESDALDLVGEVFGQEAGWVAIPIDRLASDFFQLRTGFAGAFLQKLTNYRLKVAFVGDLTDQIEASGALADFVRESNRGRQVWFVRDEAELEARLAAIR